MARSASRIPLALLTTVVIVLGTGCGRDPDVHALEFAGAPGRAPVRVLREDAVVAEYDWQFGSPQTRTFRQLVQYSPYDDDDQDESDWRLDPALAFEILTAGGWERLRLPSRIENPSVVRKGHDRRTVRVGLVHLGRLRRHLAVDNRAHAAVVIAMGALRLEVPKDATRYVSFDAGAASDHQVLLDGRSVGELGSDGTLLIDTSGARTYRLRKRVYALPGVRTEEPFDKTYTAKHRHVVPAISPDAFLVPAPASVQGVALGRRWELLDVER